MDEKFLLIALKYIPQIGDILARKILHQLSLTDIFFSSESWLIKSGKLPPRLAKNIVRFKEEALKRTEHEIKILQQQNIGFLSILDDFYPSRLRNCEDAPLYLFYKGNLDVLQMKYQLSVVGTRNITSYGKKLTEQLIQSLSALPICIISGLAAGVDTIAHEEALRNNLPTVAVLGHGFSYIYPAENKSLALRIVERGLLLTEYLSDVKPEKINFPQRNRIIAGLSDAVVVVESGKKGGALITADLAFNYDRDVFAFPGNVSHEKSQGCHWLIKTQRASLIECGEDLIKAMKWDGKVNSFPSFQSILPLASLTEQARQVLQFIEQNQPCTLDDLYKKFSILPSELSSILLELELEGLIRSLPGKHYVVS
ncbi:MAG: DNA-processing protein DprA [Bacteroidales bacterium]|nr:DNA-processing protein DprA [Bacteroidales bacterium]